MYFGLVAVTGNGVSHAPGCHGRELRVRLACHGTVTGNAAGGRNGSAGWARGRPGNCDDQIFLPMNTPAGTELPISHNVSEVLVTVTTEVEQTEVTPITAPEEELQRAAATRVPASPSLWD